MQKQSIIIIISSSSKLLFTLHISNVDHLPKNFDCTDYHVRIILCAPHHSCVYWTLFTENLFMPLLQFSFIVGNSETEESFFFVRTWVINTWSRIHSAVVLSYLM
jgi:hypothetical protein